MLSLTVAFVRCVDEVLQYRALQCHPRLVALTTLVTTRCTQRTATTSHTIHGLYSTSQLQLVHLSNGLQQCGARRVLMQLLVQPSGLDKEECGFATTAGLKTVQRRIDAQLDLFQRGRVDR